MTPVEIVGSIQDSGGNQIVRTVVDRAVRLPKSFGCANCGSDSHGARLCGFCAASEHAGSDLTDVAYYTVQLNGVSVTDCFTKAELWAAAENLGVEIMYDTEKKCDAFEANGKWYRIVRTLRVPAGVAGLLDVMEGVEA